jgi:preprotein translocase subunit SecY
MPNTLAEHPYYELMVSASTTLLVVAIFHAGLVIPTPGLMLSARDLSKLINTYALVEIHNHLIAGGTLYNGIGVLSLSFLPYLQAGSIMGFLVLIIPHLDRLSREGYSGKKQLKYWRYILSVFFAIIDSGVFISWLSRYNFIKAQPLIYYICAILTLTVGSLITICLVELINKKGLGNGVGVLSASGFVSALVYDLFYRLPTTAFMRESWLIFLALISLAVILTWVTNIFYMAQRRIPLRYPSVPSRKRYGEDQAHLPILADNSRIDVAILAAATVSFISSVVNLPFSNNVILSNQSEDPQGLILLIGMLSLMPILSLFYTRINFNTWELASELQKHGGYIYGVRPGEGTAKYINSIVVRLTTGSILFKNGLFLIIWFVCYFTINTLNPVLLFSQLILAITIGDEIVLQIQGKLAIAKVKSMTFQLKKLKKK